MMSRTSLLCALLFAALVGCAVGFVRTRTFEEDATAWTAWKLKHGKSYEPSAETQRFATWQKNHDFVDEWNSHPGRHTVAMTVFADLSNAEYRNLLPLRRTYTLPTVAQAPTTVPVVDWVAKGCVTAVGDQLQCGSCYAFTSTAAIEGAVCIASGKPAVALSNQELVDCTANYGSQGCSGGFMADMFQYVMDNKGIDSDAVYPYTGTEGTKCKFNKAKIAAKISSYVNVTVGSEPELIAAAAKTTVAMAIDASHSSFQMYASGVYTEPACNSAQVDHSATIVGMNHDAKTGMDYYIVKNSWGTGWGNQGYIWIAANQNNMCGIATEASYVVV